MTHDHNIHINLRLYYKYGRFLGGVEVQCPQRTRISTIYNACRKNVIYNNVSERNENMYVNLPRIVK